MTWNDASRRAGLQNMTSAVYKGEVCKGQVTEDKMDPSDFGVKLFPSCPAHLQSLTPVCLCYFMYTCLLLDTYKNALSWFIETWVAHTCIYIYSSAPHLLHTHRWSVSLYRRRSDPVQVLFVETGSCLSFCISNDLSGDQVTVFPGETRMTPQQDRNVHRHSLMFVVQMSLVFSS